MITGCSKPCFILALILVDKLGKENEKIILNSDNIYKAYSIALLIAIKTHEDIPYMNKVYASIFGMKINDLNSLENFFMKSINFRCIISIEVFKQMELNLNQFAQTNKDCLNFLYTQEIKERLRL